MRAALVPLHLSTAAGVARNASTISLPPNV
jgi:hypothetical protein